MTYDPAAYEERQARNVLSRRWATNDGQPWSRDDDEFLLEFWVLPGPQDRDELEVARAIGRTIEACRNRVHALVGEEWGRRYTKTETVTTTRTVTWTEDGSGWTPDWYVQ